MSHDLKQLLRTPFIILDVYNDPFPSARWSRGLCAYALALASACSAHAAADAAAAAQAAAPTCHDKQKKADGTCCPSGQAYEFANDICFAVGPPECAEVIFNNPEKCVPKWCWDWQDADKKPCKAFSDGCDTAGRLCTSDEIAAGGGCPAGTFPATEKLGDCAPAGYFPGSGVPRDWNGDLATLPPVPPLEDSIPEGVPPLTTLPDVNNTFFCIDEKTKEERFCTQAEMKFCHRGPKGEMPDEKKCVYVGVPWPSVCPPGFIVDEKAVVADGQLPPCLPDPADCGDDAYGDAQLQGGMDVLFVNVEKGSDGNTGTREKPLKTIGKALALAALGDTVAIAAGVYEESLVVTKAVAIRGRCAALVAINGMVGVPVLAISGEILTGEVLIRAVRLGGEGAGIEVKSGQNLRIDHVFIENVSTFGLFAAGGGAVVHGDSLVIVGTKPQKADGHFGRGMDVEMGADVTVHNARASANREFGVFTRDAGTQFSATAMLVDQTLARQIDKTGGLGLAVRAGAQVKLQQVRLTANQNAGVFVAEAESALLADQILVDRTASQQSDHQNGYGILVVQGAHALMHDVRASANRTGGVTASDSLTRLDCTRLVVDATLAQEVDLYFGHGVAVLGGAHAALQGARLSANRHTALTVSGADSRLNAAALLADGTLSRQKDDSAGAGAVATAGAELTLRYARLAANREVGLDVAGAETRVTAQHLLVDATLPRLSDNQHGVGAHVGGGAQLVLVDARLHGNRTCGLTVDGGASSVVATRLVVTGTQPQEITKFYGMGLSVLGDARLRVNQARLSGNRSAGGLLNGDGAWVGADGLLIDGTLSEVAGGQAGTGLALKAGTTLQLQGSRLLANRNVSVYADGASLQLVGVSVHGTLPAESTQHRGFGISLDRDTQASVLGCLVSNNHGAALATYQALLQLRSSVLLASEVGTYPATDAAGRRTGATGVMADGIVLDLSPNSMIEQCLVAGNQRAGLILGSSPNVKVARTLINATAGIYGLAFQATTNTTETFNVIFGASLKDRATDVMLSLPPPPEPVAFARGDKP